MQTIWGVSSRFDGRAGVTIGQVSWNCFVHPRPPIITAKKFIGSSPTRVASCRVIMMGVDDFLIQVFVVRNIHFFFFLNQYSHTA